MKRHIEVKQLELVTAYVEEVVANNISRS